MIEEGLLVVIKLVKAVVVMVVVLVDGGRLL